MESAMKVIVFFALHALCDVAWATETKNIRMYWWTNPPYIYQEDGIIKGLIPQMFSQLANETGLCGANLKVSYSQDLVSYENVTEYLKLLVSNKLSPEEIINDTLVVYGPMYHQDNTRTLENLMLYDTDGLTLVYWNFINHKIYRTFVIGVPSALPLFTLAFLCTLVFGMLLSLAEKKQQPRDFGVNFLKGTMNGIYWALVTISTVGYGDFVPKSCLGKVIALAWVSCSLILLPVFTAFLTSGITQKSISLQGKKIAVINDPDDGRIARGQRAIPIQVGNYLEAFKMVGEEKVFAALADTNTVAAMQDTLWKEYGLDAGETFDTGQKVYILVQNVRKLQDIQFWECLSLSAAYFPIEKLKPSPDANIYSSKVSIGLVIVLSVIAFGMAAGGIFFDYLKFARKRGWRVPFIKSGKNKVVEVEEVLPAPDMQLENCARDENIYAERLLLEVENLSSAIQAQNEAIQTIRTLILKCSLEKWKENRRNSIKLNSIRQ